MWQNGFSIDDGPLRAYNDQQNREFLNDVMMGRIPRELVREARGGEVMVNMEDHKDQMYEPPKVSYILTICREINSLVISLVKTLLSRNFCKKSEREFQ